ncbi:MAG TPA: AAA family ATPase [Thermoanaerobaculia bacterium]
MIHSLRVQGYRALHDLTLGPLSPLSVFLGPNGSGKSTIFDVFAFLSESFTLGLRQAWDRRGRFKELRTRGTQGPVVIELGYKEAPDMPLMTYHLAVEESSKGPVALEEWLGTSTSRVLDFRGGQGRVWGPDGGRDVVEERLSSPETIAVNTLGQLAKHPRLAALRRFITGWYLSSLSADTVKGTTMAGPQERLSPTGDNLANVIQYLTQQHPDRLTEILKALAQRVPRLERVIPEPTADGGLLLQIKDAPFEQPVPARFASDGTLKLLAYLTILYDPDPPPLIGIEEPENFLHPRLLPELAEECRQAAARTQLLVTSHSPFFVNALKADEVWVLFRDERGYTQARRAADMRGVSEFMNEGALLGDLWLEGHFDAGDPLVSSGGPR